jgi:hypothetical protein
MKTNSRLLGTIGAIIIMVVLVFTFKDARADCYSDGVRKGEIQKFSAKGLINKSWEGEMVQDGVRGKQVGQSAAVTNIWKFSVTDPAVAKKVEAAMFEGGRVAVKYCQSAFTNSLMQNTSYTVTDVKVIPK